MKFNNYNLDKYEITDFRGNEYATKENFEEQITEMFKIIEELKNE